jgi:hypothetical protein
VISLVGEGSLLSSPQSFDLFQSDKLDFGQKLAEDFKQFVFIIRGFGEDVARSETKPTFVDVEGEANEADIPLRGRGSAVFEHRESLRGEADAFGKRSLRHIKQFAGDRDSVTDIHIHRVMVKEEAEKSKDILIKP